MADGNELTAERAREVFDYCPISGVLRWKIDIRTGGQGDYARIRAGERAGTVNARGYRVVKYQRRLYSEHRLIWFIVHGSWPAQCVDHVDGDRANNRLSNLREASFSQNHCNRGVQANSASGVKGVKLDPRSGRFQARIQIDHKMRSLGYFETLSDAADAYARAAHDLHKQFARTEPFNG